MAKSIFSLENRKIIIICSQVFDENHRQTPDSKKLKYQAL